MKLSDLLPPERMVGGIPAKTLHDVAEQLIGAFVDTGVTADGEQLQSRIEETPPHEAVSVGGLAFVLHFRSNAVAKVAAALGVTTEPVALDPESEPSARVVVVLVAPYNESSVFLQAVSALAKGLGKPDVVRDLITASGDSPEAVQKVSALFDVELPGYLAVSDVMNKRPRSVWPDTPLEEVARVMVANRIAAIPVTSEHGEVLGMVTHRDLLSVTMPQYLKQLTAGETEAADEGETEQDPRFLPVREVMDRSVLCVSEDQTLADVANTIMGKDIDRFPVVREGVLIGLLTRADIVRRLFGP